MTATGPQPTHPPVRSEPITRRDVLRAAGGLAGAGLGAVLLSACDSGSSRPAAAGGGAADGTAGRELRLLSVPTPSDGGEWSELLPAFSRESGIDVKLRTATANLYDLARRGEGDLVYSHYGHAGLSAFVLEGYGLWPRTVMFNLIALLGPPSDPAAVRGLGDLGEALGRIASSGASFEVNGIPELVYLSEIVLDAGGISRGAWYVDEGLSQAPAVERASARGAYVLWGITPFLALTSQKALQLAPLITADPILQRIMVTVIVNHNKVSGVNVGGASALQDYLLSPATQAQIRAFRNPKLNIPIFFPAGRDNEASALSLGKPGQATGGGGRSK